MQTSIDQAQGSKRNRLGAYNFWLLIASAPYWAWFDSSIFRPTFFMPFDDHSLSLYSIYFIFSLLSGAIALIINALLKDKLITPFFRRRNGVILVFATVVGNLLTIAGASFSSLIVTTVGAILSGICCVLYLLFWAQQYSYQGAKSSSILIASAVAVGMFIDVVISGLNEWFAVAFTVLLPALSFCLALGSGKVEETARMAPASQSTNEAGESYSANSSSQLKSIETTGPISLDMIFVSKHLFFGLSFPLVAAFFIFGFSFGFMQFETAFYPTELYPFSSDALLISRGVTALIVFLAIYFFHHRMHFIFRIGILVGIAGFMLVPFFSLFGSNMLAVGFVVAIGYTTFDIITWTILAELAYITHREPVSTFGPGRFVVHASIVVGFVVAWIAVWTAGADFLETISTTVGYSLVVAEMLLLGENSALWTLVQSGASVKKEPVERMHGKADDIFALRRLSHIAEEFDLTERETEILRYLLVGRSRPRIAQILSISENTVNTHVQHIYRKLEVHGQQELIDRFA